MSQAELPFFKDLNLFELPPADFYDAQPRRTPSIWGYDPELPAEISVLLDPEDWEYSQQITFARDLVNNSFTGLPTGQGAVKFYPSSENGSKQLVNPVMEINGENGPGRYLVPRWQLYKFIFNTYLKVSMQEEESILRTRVEEALKTIVADTEL